MSSETIYNALPDYIVTPGDHIDEWLDEQGINAAELARRLNVTPKHVSELISGKAPLSATIALGLERVTGVPAHMWNRFEAGYREDLARIAEREELEAQFRKAKLFPLAYLRDFKFLTVSSSDKAGTVQQLLQLLGIRHLDAYEETWIRAKVAYRKAFIKNDNSYACSIWLALGEKAAHVNELPKFDRDALKVLIPRLRALTAQPDPAESLEEIRSLLKQVGVAFSLIPPIPGFGVYGATRWIAGHPVLQLSLRGKTDDQLWFTLFHELGHVLLHAHKNVFIQGTENQEETEADEFASNTLIPHEFEHRIPKTRNISAINDLASELGIAPSIVLGQAQRITKDYKWGHSLKRKLVWDPDSNEPLHLRSA